MGATLRHVQQGESHWRAELLFRAAGVALFALCASAMWWTCRWVNHKPDHSATMLEFAGAAVAMICWSLGWACLLEGPGLFRLIRVPTRYWAT